MLHFLRNIRRKLIIQDNARKYIVYAIGEILLVVIGILIALQINNWNENYKNTAKERSYLINLQQDLQADSMRLEKLNFDLEKAMQSKLIFEEYLSDQSELYDSISLHFMNQYFIQTDFIPNKATTDELLNSSGLNLITNPDLRREIVTLYNSYDELGVKLDLGTEKSQIILRYTSDKLDNILSPTDKEISNLMTDKFFVNQTRLNYLFTQSEAANRAYSNCLATLELIRKEI